MNRFSLTSVVQVPPEAVLRGDQRATPSPVRAVPLTLCPPPNETGCKVARLHNSCIHSLASRIWCQIYTIHSIMYYIIRNSCLHANADLATAKLLQLETPLSTRSLTSWCSATGPPRSSRMNTNHFRWWNLFNSMQNGPLIISVLVWDNISIHFRHKQLQAISLPVTLTFCLYTSNSLPRLLLSTATSPLTAFLLQENQRHVTDGQTDGRSATLIEACREDRIIIILFWCWLWVSKFLNTFKARS